VTLLRLLILTPARWSWSRTGEVRRRRSRSYSSSCVRACVRACVLTRLHPEVAVLHPGNELGSWQ